jgi:hypothetical protein
LVWLSAPNPGANAYAGVAIHLQIENFDGKRIPWLRPFHEKRSGQRIVALRHAERVARFLNGIAEAVKRVGIQNVAGFKVRNRLGCGEQVFHVGIRGGVVNCGLGEGRNRQQDCSENARNHGKPPEVSV